jgi:DNA mismatch repair protein MutS
LPEDVTDRAKQILKNLEGSELNLHQGPNPDAGQPHRRKPERISSSPEPQLALFELKDDKLHDELRAMDIEKMTPLEALQKLAQLKKKVSDSQEPGRHSNR